MIHHIFAMIATTYILNKKTERGKEKMKDKEFLKEEMIEEGLSLEEVEKRYDFIWGIKSLDCFTSSEANLFTMNDIDIIFNKEEKLYYLSIETAYMFRDQKAECKYLRDLLDAFTLFMKEKGYNTEEPYFFWMSSPFPEMKAESIPELYTNFRIVVEGYNALYGKGDENE